MQFFCSLQVHWQCPKEHQWRYLHPEEANVSRTRMAKPQTFSFLLQRLDAAKSIPVSIQIFWLCYQQWPQKSLLQTVCFQYHDVCSLFASSLKLIPLCLDVLRMIVNDFSYLPVISLRHIVGKSLVQYRIALFLTSTCIPYHHFGNGHESVHYPH